MLSPEMLADFCTPSTMIADTVCSTCSSVYTSGENVHFEPQMLRMTDLRRANRIFNILIYIETLKKLFVPHFRSCEYSN